ncbi:hypothetical protein M568_00580 [Salmonella enterica subsp. enterica serovar Namur str. 05-2929]|uniref:hypothetical protein n=1 Tax=Salmonella enterica TaxID=28901 RepID=UPI0004369934|nr:hypothetical protein [Salmonella enterica]EBF8609274.1 hypothetical protein [Salmonella enterica subsp. enterica serovar Nagoya]ECP0317534.1 hypothetical protein [Salmonella enterica subsp. enterica]EDQ9893565.1 hypothetical protein [Salmonella enterica subsp. enterica]EXX84018.1 hypothetical protein M568_00580 [Salmonella enterica subsp. enterica serovar Namur str. 05-2929]
MTERTSLSTSIGNDDADQWLTAEGFAGMEGMPSTPRGARLRLEKLAAMHPEIKRKRTGHKGFVYHISAAEMSLKTERGKQQEDRIEGDEQLNLWIQLFKTMKPSSREKMLKIAMEQVASDLSSDTK